MPRYRITEVNGQLVAGNGARMRGKYALYYGSEFIAVADRAEDLLKYQVSKPTAGLPTLLVIATLILLAEKIVNWMVPL